MEEIWKDIKGYEGLYQVSNLGNIKSLNYNKTGKEKILKPTKQSCNYLRITLSKNGKGKIFLIHRLVAETFLPNPYNLPQVNHKDENTENNCVENLEFCDRKYNINWGTGVKRSAKNRTNGKCSKAVLQYDLVENFIKEFPSLKEVQRQLGYHTGSISNCCNGKTNTAYGYKWQYK